MSVTKNIFRFALVVLILMSLVSCRKSTSTLSPVPQAIGSLSRIVVVADSSVWKSPVQDSIYFYLGAAYPVLPQPEPLFDIQFYSMESFEQYPDRYRFKNILFLADMSTPNAPTPRKVKKIVGAENIKKMMLSPEKAEIKVTKNVWANGQTIFFVFAEDKKAMIEELKKKSGSIAKLAKENDEKLLRERVFRRGRNEAVMDEIKSNFDIDLTLPSQYKLAINNKEQPFMLIRKTDPASHVHSNLMISSIPFKKNTDFTQERVKQLRNELGKEYIKSAMIEGSYMRINDIDLPLYSELTKIDSVATLKVYGIWEMNDIKDMMGGAFVSYLVYDEKKERLIFIDGFTFAPGKKKRELMQSIELIMSTIKLNE